MAQMTRVKQLMVTRRHSFMGWSDWASGLAKRALRARVKMPWKARSTALRPSTMVLSAARA